MAQSGYKIRDQQQVYFITSTVVQWVDIFTRPIYANLVIESLNFCVKEKGLCVHAWVLMPNHFHGIVSAREGCNLSDILRDFKKFTAGKILKELDNSTFESRKNWMLWLFKSAGNQNSRNENFQFWQQENHPVELNNPELKAQRMNYLHQNPVRAGLVWEPWEYRYSSACDYMNNKKGLVEIDFI
jgi:REP element-mobilizing transposase RayT